MLFVEGLIHGARFKNMYKSGKRICTKQHNPVQEEKRGEKEQNCNDYKFLFVFFLHNPNIIPTLRTISKGVTNIEIEKRNNKP